MVKNNVVYIPFLPIHPPQIEIHNNVVSDETIKCVDQTILFYEHYIEYLKALKDCKSFEDCVNISSSFNKF